MAAEEAHHYVDLRFGNKGHGRFAYLLGLFGQGVIVAVYVFWFLPMAVAQPYTKGAIAIFLSFLLFFSIFLLHLRATLRARRLVQEAVVDEDSLWIRCMFGQERRLRRHDVTGRRWIRGRDWFNFMDASYMDNADRSNIALDLSDGSVLYVFNDGNSALRLLEALSMTEASKTRDG